MNAAGGEQPDGQTTGSSASAIGGGLWGGVAKAAAMGDNTDM